MSIKGARSRRAVGAVALLAAISGAPAAAYQRPGTNQQVDYLKGRGAPDGYSYYSSMSDDGRFVAFDTNLALVPADLNEMTDVYVRDMRTDRLWLASQTPNGTPTTAVHVPDSPFCAVRQSEREGYWAGSGPRPSSWDPAISGDGRFVAFVSWSADLVLGDTNLAPDVFVFDRRKQVVERVSVNSDGDEGVNKDLLTALCLSTSWSPSIDRTGRRVTFSSFDTNLVERDTNSAADIFMHDRKTDKTIRVSVPSTRPEGCAIEQPAPDPVGRVAVGCPVSGQSEHSSISANGRFVAFESHATDLVRGDTNALPDVFVRDLKKKRTERVSLDSAEDQIGDDPPPLTTNSEVLRTYTGLGMWEGLPQHSISGDGRYVVFVSSAQDAIPSSGTRSVFIRDRKAGRTQKASVSSNGDKWLSIPENYAPSISRNGRFVFFNGGSNSKLYAAGSTHDLTAGATDLMALSDSGAEEDGCEPSTSPYYAYPVIVGDIDAHGRYLTFSTCMTNLQDRPVKATQNHVVRRDHGRRVMATLKASGVGMRGASAFERDGLVEVTDAVEPSIASAGDVIGARLVHRPSHGDLFAAIDVERLSTPVRLGLLAPGLVHGLAFSVGDTHYEVRAVPDLGGTFALFDVTGAPLGRKVVDLSGGYGTTGERIVLSLPLDALGLENGGQLADVVTFTGFGGLHTGALERLDVVRLER